jgi:hypothetical protein
MNLRDSNISAWRWLGFGECGLSIAYLVRWPTRPQTPVLLKELRA